MLDKILNRIKNSKRITKHSKVRRIDDRLTVETYNEYCIGIFIDGIEVKTYSKLYPDQAKEKEAIQSAIKQREAEIKQELIESLDII